jgi:hypothetical protein
MFHTYVVIVFIWMLLIYAMVFKCFFKCFYSVSDICFKCFICLLLYDVNDISGYFKSRLSIALDVRGKEDRT